MSSVREVIRKHQDEIIELWSDETTKAASARGLSRPELMNIIPRYLDALAETPPEEFGRFSGKRRELVLNHISGRLRYGFDLAEVIEEFAILGRAFSQVCDTLPRDDRPETKDTHSFFLELIAASSATTESYREHLMRDEQAEKRYMRLLQTIANDALDLGAVPFRHRLQDVLKLILEAMDAQSAALLLFDIATQKLITAASVGAANELLEHYATSLDTSTFPGRIAADEMPTTVMDTMTTELEVSETLREGGIHSLLGVRLPPHRKLLGVLYVGLFQTREFSAAEIQRIELLGDRLTLHLENAGLYADLQEKIDSLTDERRLRERFVSVLAHDLRGPLFAAKVNTTLLLGQPELPVKLREIALRISRNIDQTDRMVQSLLDANLIRAGDRLSLSLDRCDLSAIARDVVEELVPIHGQRFALQAEEDIWGTWDADVLRRALWNLASNAIKYGTEDQPITIGVRRSDQGAEVFVHNEGAVISREDQALLFKPFSRTRAAQAGPTKGWGLGLTLVYGCAEAHGGRVQVKSTASEGTTFRLNLPLDARPYQPRVEAALPPASAHAAL